VVLNYYRYGRVLIPPNILHAMIELEFQYFEIPFDVKRDPTVFADSSTSRSRRRFHQNARSKSTSPMSSESCFSKLDDPDSTESISPLPSPTSHPSAPSSGISQITTIRLTAPTLSVSKSAPIARSSSLDLSPRMEISPRVSPNGRNTYITQQSAFFYPSTSTASSSNPSPTNKRSISPARVSTQSDEIRTDGNDTRYSIQITSERGDSPLSASSSEGEEEQDTRPRTRSRSSSTHSNHNHRTKQDGEFDKMPGLEDSA